MAIYAMCTLNLHTECTHCMYLVYVHVPLSRAHCIKIILNNVHNPHQPSAPESEETLIVQHQSAPSANFPVPMLQFRPEKEIEYKSVRGLAPAAQFVVVRLQFACSSLVFRSLCACVCALPGPYIAEGAIVYFKCNFTHCTLNEKTIRRYIPRWNAFQRERFSKGTRKERAFLNLPMLCAHTHSPKMCVCVPRLCPCSAHAEPIAECVLLKNGALTMH